MPHPVSLFIRRALIGFLPVFFFLSGYVWLDPFKVIGSYNCYYQSGAPSYVNLNMDVVSTETFRRNHQSRQYDSFIFGNSRSGFYEVKDWEDHVLSRRCFHFAASAETLFGIHSKVLYLDRHGTTISNALIVVDRSTLEGVENSEGHLFIKHPIVSGGSYLEFHILFLKRFGNPKFLLGYLNPPMVDRLFGFLSLESPLSKVPMDYEPGSNEYSYPYFEAMIATNLALYYGPRQKIFYTRSSMESFSRAVVGERQKAMLSEIVRIFKKHGSSYKVVVQPLYDQRKISPDDLSILKSTFGEKDVHDFSGVNEITKYQTNYYEISHYRPHVAREIMSVIYGKP